jgi:hypothetical protein
MSISIYYSAQRKKELSLSEIKAVEETAARYSVNAQIENLVATGVGLNWEFLSFSDQH